MQTEAGDARITVQQKGSIVPIVQHAVHRSPAFSLTSLVIEHHAHEGTEFPRREPESHIVYLHTGASVQADIEGSRVSGTRWFRRGMVWVMPEGSEHAVRFHGKVEGMGVSFSPKLFDQLLTSADAALSRQVEERIVTDQPKLEYLMRALWCESLEPTEPGLLAAECIAVALALTLTQPGKNAQQHAFSGLTGRQLRTILCFVKSHISEPMSLQVLANPRDSEYTGLSNRPDLVGDSSISADSPRTQTGPPVTAFARQAYGRPGTLGRNVFTGPAFFNTDTSLIKNTRITETLNAQFRAEIFNAFNQVHLDQLGNNIGDPGTFGISTTAALAPDGAPGMRQIQLALKLIF